ncbi:MAG: ferritin-like domain-containing protein [Betaproteobacteria bacterium]
MTTCESGIGEMARANFNRAIVQLATMAPDVGEVVRLLNNCLANEICRSLQVSRGKFLARKLSGATAVGDSSESFGESQLHADLIATRIIELGGELDFQRRIFEAKGKLALACWGADENVAEDTFAAESLVIDGYHDLLHCLGNHDSKTRELVERLRGLAHPSSDVAI